MKISNIKIMNFKGIESLEVKPARINILSEPNGMGKTSMLEGIRCAITGKTPDDYMAMGTSKSSVAVELEKLGTIERRYTPSKSKPLMCGKATTAKDVARDLGGYPWVLRQDHEHDVLVRAHGADDGRGPGGVPAERGLSGK